MMHFFVRDYLCSQAEFLGGGEGHVLEVIHCDGCMRATGGLRCPNRHCAGDQRCAAGRERNIADGRARARA
jgi:hypothetical protein